MYFFVNLRKDITDCNVTVSLAVILVITFQVFTLYYVSDTSIIVLFLWEQGGYSHHDLVHVYVLRKKTEYWRIVGKTVLNKAYPNYNLVCQFVISYSKQFACWGFAGFFSLFWDML